MKPKMLVPVLVLLMASPTWGQEKKDLQTFEIPYRLTDTQHVLVRIKINGKGPFNFIVDTGAPVPFLATDIGKKIGLKPDERSWAILDRLEFEGGAVQTKVKCRVETVPQVEAMNALGFAGAELHGILGYTVLARYRLEFDFTKDKMKWTELAFDPPPPQPVGGKGGGGSGLEMIASIAKLIGFLAGKKTAPEMVPRGFLGFELADQKGLATVHKVLAGSPAARAGLEPGDQIQEIQGRTVQTVADVLRLSAQIRPGQEVILKVDGGGKKKEIKIIAGEGL